MKSTLLDLHACVRWPVRSSGRGLAVSCKVLQHKVHVWSRSQALYLLGDQGQYYIHGSTRLQRLDLHVDLYVYINLFDLHNYV